MTRLDDDIDESEGAEAEAQREETVMPWIWGAIGVLAIAGFVVWYILWPSLGQIRHPAAAAPISKPISQHY